MDPLSVTAGIIAILQLANKVITIGLSLHASLTVRKELDQIINEVDSLRAVLQKLARLSQTETQNNSTAILLVDLDDHRARALSICRTELVSLEAELAKAKLSGSQFGLSSVKLIGIGKEIKTRLERLSRAKQTLQLSLALDDYELSLQSRMDSLHIRSTLDDATDERDRRSIIDWLGPPFPTSAFNDAQRLRSTNTGTWFLDGNPYRCWKHSPHSTLWLSGIPGSGKTVLCSSIIVDLNSMCRSSHNGLLLYFFFEFTNRDKEPVGTFLRSVLSQAVVQRREIPPSIQELFDQHHNGFQQPNISILLATLMEILESEKEIYLVLDALDECSERVQLLEAVKEIISRSLDNLHILATSRPEKDIENIFTHIQAQHMRLEGSAVSNDIEQYVQNKLLKEQWLHKWPQGVQDEIVSGIVAKAGDMFRLADMQLNGLKKCGTLKLLRAALRTLPTSLDETYSRILDSIEPEHVEAAVRILQWLCFSFAPLTLSELAEGLAVDLHENEYDETQQLQDLEDILSICGSLVVRARNSASTVKLSHYSVKEYLISNRILRSKNEYFHIDVASAELCIAKTCLIYLRSRSAPSRSRCDSESRPASLTQYAIDHWPEHFHRSGQNKTLQPLAEQLLFNEEVRFLEWARIYCVSEGGNYTETLKQHDLNAILYYVAWVGSPSLMEATLKRGAEINVDAGAFGTALNVSACLGSIECLQLLLAWGADINYQAGIGCFALRAAAGHGSVESVRFLLSHGADVNMRHKDHLDSLHAAICAHRNRDRTVGLLLEAGADVRASKPDNQPMEVSPLCALAVMDGAVHLARLLLDRGAEANRAGCLQEALRFGHIDLANLLLERGADVNGDDLYGRPVMDAAMNQVAVLSLLVERWNADYLWTDSAGRSVLHLAAQDGTFDTVEYLLGLGMSIDQTDARGWTAIHYAADAGAADKLKLLLSRQSTKISNLPIAMATTTWTPLHLACRRNESEALDLLLQAGFKPTTVATKDPPWEWSLYDIALVHRNYRLISENLDPIHPLLIQERASAQRPLMPLSDRKECDGCFPKPGASHLIFGPVFHCDECLDFDYCFMCRMTADQMHPHSSWSILQEQDL
ncbi:ankyrin [Byssothecium circinans]|uniref:Ankyrin n=1 Tax=Byssothecium circinans TaxID=147558 RepID=A0A6A5T6H7_9PLEO|nr:ankyrin [Byssothecium circinans]KAF1948243.1 ankyrin [Byssothecium circinans]